MLRVDVVDGSRLEHWCEVLCGSICIRSNLDLPRSKTRTRREELAKFAYLFNDQCGFCGTVFLLAAALCARTRSTSTASSSFGSKQS